MIDKKTHYQIKPIIFKEFLRRYDKDIRPEWDTEHLKDNKTGTFICEDNTFIYLPWYKPEDDCIKGKPVRIKRGAKNNILRIPAIKVFDSFLALDGCHRLTGLSPKVIILDYIEIKKTQYKHFQDLSNIYWQAYINREGLGYVY